MDSAATHVHADQIVKSEMRNRRNRMCQAVFRP